MYIHVKLLNGFSQPLTYKAPGHWPKELIGSIVKVPLKDRTVTAYVYAQSQTLASTTTFTIKEAYCQEKFPADIYYQKFINQLSYYYQVEAFHFIKRIKHFISQDAEQNPLATPTPQTPAQQIILTLEQTEIIDAINPLIGKNIYSPALLHGVTGSGKTEVYKELIKQTINEGKTAILLLPEVSLALRFEHLLKTQLANTCIILGFHSGTSAKEKRILWQALLEQKPILIIGVHIPILLPIANLGLIIVDEEHETGYQEKKHPKINTKEAALIRAQLYRLPILLGSATPSISTLYAAKNKGWQIFSLHKRFAGSFPEIKVVLLTNKEKRKNFWITKELQNAIADRLAKKEQVIIFLNRRGYSFFVQCKDCSYIFECTSCSVSLTLHNSNELTCHYCGRCQQLKSHCPACKTQNLIKKGIGTQQVVTILEQLFPHAKIGRADMDISSKKKMWQQTMGDFESGVLDILVGTQTITKGLHFPNVTLVGIIWADLNLHFPVYNAAEVSLQQLIQVAGRAGRAKAASTVIVQTMLQHPIFNYLNELDYAQYYDYELKSRQQVQYPPMIRLVEIELKNTNEELLDLESANLAQQFSRLIQKNNYQIIMLGPAKPPVSKIKNTYSRKVYLKSKSIQEIIELYKLIDRDNFKSYIFFTPNPH